MGEEERLLLISAQRGVVDARSAIDRIHEFESSFQSIKDVDNTDEDHMAWKDALKFYTEQVFQETAMLAERLRLPLLAGDIRQCRDKLRSTFRDINLDPYVQDPYSEALNRSIAYLRSIENMLDPSELGAGIVFRTTLENTALIIAGQGLDPKNEAEVRNAVHKILLYGFRDAKKEVKIPKTIKNYRLDVAVPSLRAAAEYKFADSESEAKKAIDEIYADMRGYGGEDNWRTFYAVIYMTAPFLHQKDVELDFKLSRSDLNWHPIILNGPGQRKASTNSAVAAKATHKKAMNKGTATKKRSST